MSLLLVVLAVTGCAFPLQLEHGLAGREAAPVAALALGALVLVAQRVLGIPVMIEVDGLPAFFVVAGFALVTQATLVAFFLVVPFMAGNTFARQLGLVDGAFFRKVAAVALGGLVLAAQCIVRVDVMVEAQLSPGPVAVATFALDPVIALVAFILVVLPVTADAIARSALVAAIDMTFLAFHLGMLAADELKPGLFMIEAVILPVPFDMATDAFFAQLALMHIVLSVAGVAIRWRLAKFLLAALVAGDTLYFTVLIAQRKVGLGMVEGLFVEDHDLRLASLMLGMTDTALGFLQTAVVSQMQPKVLRDLLVAIAAESALRALVEAYMAFIALLLIFGVALDDFAGH